MSTATAVQPTERRAAGLFSRLLSRFGRLLSYIALPGYYPLSHAYHFPPRQQAASPVHAPRTKTVRLPAAPFHR